MQIRGIPFKNSIFLRLFFTFILIIIPMVWVGFGIYSWGVSAIKDEITHSMQSQVKYFMESLEDELGRVNLLQSDLSNSVKLRELARTSFSGRSYDRDMEVVRTVERIQAIKSSSRFTEQVSVYLMQQDKSINTDVTIDNISDIDRELINGYRETPDEELYYYNGDFYLNYIFPMREKDDPTLPEFIASTRLSTERIEKALQVYVINDEATSFLYSPKYDVTIGESRETPISQKIKECILESATDCQPTTSTLSRDGGSFPVTLDDDDYLVSYTESLTGDFVFVAYTPEDVLFKKIESYKALIWTYSVITAIAIMAIFSFAAYRFVHRPLSRLIIAFNRVEQGDMNEQIRNPDRGEFRYIFDSFNRMVKNLRSLIDQAYKQKILVQKAELKQLQSQINPHFLYNSFFILTRRIKQGDSESALWFSQHLGNYFQYIARNASDEVQLSSEVEHARIYSDIQAMRFSNRIMIEFDPLPQKYTQVVVPRLILQPVIENAFEYGLEELEGEGRLTIQFEGDGEDQLTIHIEDNGRKLTDEDLELMGTLLDSNDEFLETTGVINIHKRIQLKYGKKSGLTLTRGTMGGLRVSIHLNFGGDKA